MEKITMLMLEISSYQGAMTLSKKERVKIGVTAPRKVVNSLSKQVINPRELAEFAAIKKKAQRICARAGVRMFGGYAVPTEEMKTLGTELNTLQSQYQGLISDFVMIYTRLASEWQSDNPEWKSLLSKAHSPERVEKAFAFSWSAMVITPSDTKGSSTSKQLEGIGCKAFEEVATEARYFWKKALSGRDHITQRTLGPINDMIKKLDGLSFVDPKITPFVDHAQKVLVGLPKSGAMEGGDLSAVAGLIMMMSRGDGMILNMKVPSSVMTDEDEAEDFAILVQNAKPPTPTSSPTVSGWF